MPRPTTRGGTLFGPKTAAAFLVGVGVGLAIVAPVLPASVGTEIVSVLDAGGSVVLAGVAALALLMVLLALFYQLYL